MKHIARAVFLAFAVLVLGCGVAPRPRSSRWYSCASIIATGPSNMSIYEEGTISIVAPIMGVFNNLVVF